MPKIGLMLSGCGVYDGSEIQESVIAMLALDRADAEIICMAPNTMQREVIDHLTGEPTNETRNVLTESARIARGEIKDVKEVHADQLDALILPGGFGAAKNLSDFALVGKDATVQEDVSRLLKEMVAAAKPVGAICIAPATLAKAVAERKPVVTIGNDAETATAIEATGATHRECTVDMIHVDERNRIVTTPAYMLGPRIKDVALGIEKLVQQVLQMVATS